MRIKNIKVNSYGNLKDKEINLENINIIYGKNESGKSTLLNFIKNIFYGISKNKNGRDISDYDKYYPWEGDIFSGKVKYELDNKEVFEIYRDFAKKNTEIYNEQLEEISDRYKVDKKTGVQVFKEQTGIDESTFISTAFAMQKEVTLDSNTQANLIQKVANLAESGMEDVSYKKAITDLNAMLLSEVGTNNSKDRPINIARQHIQEYTNELNKNMENKIDVTSIEQEINELNKTIEVKTNKEILLNKIKSILDKKKIENEKINIKEKICEENKNKINQLNSQIEDINNKIKKHKNNSKSKNKKLNIIIFVILIIINICNFIFIKNKIANILLLSLIPIYIIWTIIKSKKIPEDNELSNQIKVLEGKIELLEKNNQDIKKEVTELRSKISEKIKLEQERIINENNLEEDITELFNSNIDLIEERNRKDLEEYKLQLHKLEIDRENINPILENIINLEEMLDIEKENLEDLEKRAEEFSITKELIEDAYTEMKKNVSPKFSQKLSMTLEEISNGKYKNITINDGLVIELDNGKYINAESLSIGTIEQIYLALRLSVIEELSKEKLPIMLDEAFAYYDSERLKSALDFLSKCNHQILIFTCTNREKEILDSMNIKYNYIELG